MKFEDVFSDIEIEYARGRYIINTDNYNKALEKIYYSKVYMRELTEWLFLWHEDKGNYNQEVDDCLKNVSIKLIKSLDVKGNRQDKRVSFCKVLLFNMLRAYYRRTRIYIPCCNKFDNNKHFFPFTHNIASSVIRPLVHNGFLVEIKGESGKNKESSFLSSYFPKDKLIEDLLKIKVFQNQSLFDTFQKDAIYFNEKSKEDYDVETDRGKKPCDKQKLKKELAIINKYNALRYNSVITFNINSDIIVNQHIFITLLMNSLKIDMEGIVTLRNNYAVRIFNDGNYETGGRFYRSLETRISEDIRKNLMINGNPVVELDYSGFHLRMLYHENEIDYRDDPYSGLSQNLRPVYKIVALCSINASNEKKAIQAIRNEIRKMIKKDI